MEVQVAVAKTHKYATSESGDTLEVIERPNGGLSVVLADGQSSGPGAKAISMMVVRKVLALLSEGVRDGAAARAASDALYTEKKGKVSCTLNIISVDLQSGTLVLTRNNPAPVFICREESIQRLEEPAPVIGTARNIRPSITEFNLVPGLTLIVCTDGLIHAGSRYGRKPEIETTLRALFEERQPAPQEIADALMSLALTLDEGRPGDDISIVVLSILSNGEDNIRRMSVRLPFRYP
jgi:serine phosphatase RsbU (regulator of sigma subunit)